jgi:hypothetical protein
LGTSWDAQFELCGRKYKHAYYLVDGIYPQWSTLIKAKLVSQDAPLQHFQKLQEAFRTDIERAFGVLQSHWSIIANPACFWSPEDMVSIMRTCVILHNMILEDQECKLTDTFQLPNFITLVPPRSECYNERKKNIRLLKLQSAVQHQKLTNNIIDVKSLSSLNSF